MIAWAFIKEGSTSRYLASCVVRKNLCPGITVRLATPPATIVSRGQATTFVRSDLGARDQFAKWIVYNMHDYLCAHTLV